MLIKEETLNDIKNEFIKDLCRYSLILTDISIKLYEFEEFKNISGNILKSSEEIINFVSKYYDDKSFEDNNIKYSDTLNLNDNDIEAIKKYKIKLEEMLKG